MPRTSSETERTVGKHTLELSSLEKVMIPDGITKGMLIDYYEAIAPLMLPHIKDRPLTLQRYPQGIGRPGFFQKEAPDYYPDFIQRAPVEHSDGEITENCVANNVETLVYLANQNTVVIHNWLARRDKIRYPDRVAFDLDPNGDTDFSTVCKGALIVRDALAELQLTSFPMVTGSRGIHVVLSLKRLNDYKVVADWTHGFADALAEAHPKLFTTEFYKGERGDRIFVDWLRNQYAQTAAAPYTVRAKAGGPVAVPVTWAEVKKGKVGLGKSAQPLAPDMWTVRDAAALLQRGDPWAGFSKSAVRLPKLELRA